jgi:protein-disulfide isomerase
VRLSLGFLTVVLGVAPGAVALPPACDALQDAERRTAERILTTEYLYDCCDDTIAACLAAEPTCALAFRLAENVCRRVAEGQDEERIRRALSRRARSMMGGGALATFDLQHAPTVGQDRVPVTVVVYACARCPYCSKLVPALYSAVVSGKLRGDARLVFRYFPIRGHEGSTEAGLAFVAAAEEGGFWSFMLHAYRHFETYAPGIEKEWAEAIGLDPEVFAARLADPAIREGLVESKKEGLRNGVEETPTLFLNGRRWVGDLTVAEIVDAIQEEVQRVRGERWVTP